MREKSEEQHLHDAEVYCAKAERAPREVLQWLSRRSLNKAQTAFIMARLTEAGFIDEQRYVSLYASDKLRFNGWGPYKIKHMLYEKGLDGALVNTIVPQVMEEEGADDILRSLLEQRLRLLQEVTPELLERKVVQWAVNRGFALKDVWRILKEIQEEPNN